MANQEFADIYPTPTYFEGVRELTTMEEEKLKRQYNLVVKALHDEGRRVEDKQPYLVHAQIYLSELARRRTEEQAKEMERLTRTIDRLTWVITHISTAN